MIFLASLAVLGLLTVFFDAQLESRWQRELNPNQEVVGVHSGGVNQVVLEANIQDHYVATAHINGEPVEVMVDTGATQIAIAAHAARRLKLRFGERALVSTANGTTAVHLTQLQSVRLGNIAVNNVEAAIVPNMESPEVLLGMNFLRDLEMTHRGGQLILKQY